MRDERAHRANPVFREHVAHAATHDQRRALDAVRSQYSAAYVPTNRSRDGGFRRLKVEIVPQSPLTSRQVVIQGPDGYFAPLESSQQR